MKKKLLLTLSVLGLSALSITACKKKETKTTNAKTIVTTSNKGNTTSNSGNKTTTTQTRKTTTKQQTTEAQPVVLDSKYANLLEDMQKTTLPSSYAQFSRNAFQQTISLNNSEITSRMSNIDCFEQNAFSTNGEFKFDINKNLSSNGNYYGHVLGGQIAKVNGYITDLLNYERNLYGNVTDSYYIYNNELFIILLKSQSNKDVVIIDQDGVISSINLTSDYAACYETDFINKNTLDNADLLTLNNGRVRVYSDGAEVLYENLEGITTLNIVSSYRNLAVKDVDIDSLKKYESLENITVDSSNTKLCSVNGILYNIDMSELIYCPISNQVTNYTTPSTIKTIRSGAFLNNKNLSTINLTNVNTIGDNAFSNTPLTSVVMTSSVTSMGSKLFANCKNLEVVTLPFIGKNAEDSKTNTFHSFFSTEENSDMNVVDLNGTNYYIPSIEEIYLLGGSINEESFYGFTSNLDVLHLPKIEEVTYDLLKDFKEIDDFDINDGFKGIKVIGDAAFKEFALPSSLILPDAEIIGDRAFEDCTTITSVTANKVIILNSAAFVGCSNLTSVTFNALSQVKAATFDGFTSLTSFTGPSVTEIDLRAFGGCENLEEFTFGNVTHIGLEAFAGCSKITEIEFDYLTSLEPDAFLGCPLVSVSLDSLQEVSDDLFKNLTTLTHISLASVESIGSDAFKGCSGLEDALAFNNLKELGDEAFKDCTNIPSISMNSLTDLGLNAFNGCTNLTTISVNALEAIGNSAFEGASALESISMNSATTIGENAFKDCTSLTTISFANITSIALNGFKNCTSLTSVPANNVISLGNAAFAECSNLKTIELESINTIGENAFFNCSKLDTIIIGDDTNVLENLESIGEGAFYGCASLTTISLPDIITIPKNLFNGCSLLVTVSIPLATSMGEGVFSGCTKLQSINIANVTEIAVSLFEGCTSLENIVITNATKIGSKAFRNCTSLSSINLDNVTSLGTYAFQGCTALQSISLPKITALAGYVFNSCSNLETVILNDNLVTINSYVFKDCVKLANIDLSKVKLFGDAAFYGCKLLESIDLSGVTGETNSSIGYYAFKNCTALTTVKFSSERTNYVIPMYCFDGCTSLDLNNDESYKNAIKSIESYAFRNCTSLSGTLLFNNVTGIYDSAFKGCTGFTNFSATKTTSISYKIFDGNDGSKGFIDLGLTTINENNMVDLKKFIKVCLNDLVTTTYAFGGEEENTYLTNVEMRKLTTMPSGMFKNCTALLTVKMGSLTSIPNYAFYNCQKLSAVSFNQNIYGPITNVTSIGDYAFYNCISTDFVGLSRTTNVSSLGEHCFEKCYYLKSATFSSNLTEIPNSAFMDCVRLTKITAGTITKIGEYSFSNTAVTNTFLSTLFSNLTEIPNYAFYKDCTGIKETLTIPSNIKKIGNYAFYRATNMEEVIINDANTIGDYAFSKCYILASIMINTSTDTCEIGQYAFTETIVQSITLPTVSTTIGAHAFEDVTALVGVFTFPYVTTVDYSAFKGCYNIREFYAENCTSLGSYSFSGCTSLTTAYFPLIKDVHSYAFYNCTSLTASTISPSAKTIGAYAYYNCPINYMGADNIRSVGEYAYYGTKVGLAKVYSSDGITVGTMAFGNCSELLSVWLSGSSERKNNSISSTAFDMSHVTCVRLGKTLRFYSMSSMGFGPSYRGDIYLEINHGYASTSTDDYNSFYSLWMGSTTGINSGNMSITGYYAFNSSQYALIRWN